MLREHFTGTAAELAYYGLLSAAPCIAAFVGILGLLGSNPETAEAIATIVGEGVSPEAGDAAQGTVRRVLDRDGAAGIALGIGAVTTLWVASIYLAAFRRAAYRVHHADPGPTWRGRPLQMGLTVLGLVALALVALLLAVTKRVVREIGEAVGAEDATVAIWSLARWPLVFLLVVLVTAGLYNRPADGTARRANRERGLGRGGARLVAVLGGVRGLGRELRRLRRDLRGARGRGGLRGLALDLQPRSAVRHGARPRAQLGPEGRRSRATRSRGGGWPIVSFSIRH
jgi:hypothetical protein